MAFIFNWPQFSEETLSLAKLSLAEAINSGEKPDNVVGEIVVSDVNFGPPYLELLEICEISINRFRGLFKVQYDGDFHLELTLKVQVNPVKAEHNKPRSIRKVGILAANKPLILPVKVKLSFIRLSGIAILEIDDVRGVMLNFKYDPLVGLKVNTSFDNEPTISEFLYNLLKEMLRSWLLEDLPELVYTLSKKSLLTLAEDTKENCLQRKKGADAEIKSDNLEKRIKANLTPYLHTKKSKHSRKRRFERKIAALHESNTTMTLQAELPIKLLQKSSNSEDEGAGGELHSEKMLKRHNSWDGCTEKRGDAALDCTVVRRCRPAIRVGEFRKRSTENLKFRGTGLLTCRVLGRSYNPVFIETLTRRTQQRSKAPAQE